MEAYGITRNGLQFRGSPRTYATAPPAGGAPRVLVDAEGYSASLRELIAALSSPSGVRLFKAAYRQNMIHKMERYEALHVDAREYVREQEHIINLKIPELKRVAQLPRGGETSDNWSIFQSISDQYNESKARATVFEALRDRAASALEGDMGRDDVLARDAAKKMRDRLVEALHELSDFAAQAHVVEKAVEIVASFLKNPRLFHTKTLNFMLLGRAGTGKTTIAGAIGRVFGAAGLFIGNKVVEAGRAELVGQYEGQTVARTREFLVNNLDAGVIFIDEAYGITTWHEGRPEAYGSEATTAMVEFMTRYKGLYCIFVAGYEEDMTRYFLPTNQGLDRRFPDKFALQDMDADELVTVFKRHLLKTQGLTPPNGRSPELESTHYFTKEAWHYLRQVVHVSLQGDVTYVEEYDGATRRTYDNVRRFVPTWRYVYLIFKYQAGSMVNLAEEAITVLMGTVTFEDTLKLVRASPGAQYTPAFKPQPRPVMREILVRMIEKSALSSAYHYMREFEQIESLI